MLLASYFMHIFFYIFIYFLQNQKLCRVSVLYESTSVLTVTWTGKQLQYFVTMAFAINIHICIYISVSYLHTQYISVYVY